MRVTYRLPVLPGVALTVPPSTNPVTVDGATVEWGIDSSHNLTEVRLIFVGAEIRYSDTGAIMHSYPELDEKAYKIATYLSGAILVQSGHDAIRSRTVLLKSPDAAPENAAEDALWAITPKVVGASLDTGWSSFRNLVPTQFGLKYRHSQPYGYLAESMRLENVFQKYEMQFKVLEYFVDETHDRFDNGVSGHISQFDPSYTPAVIKSIRILRNRIVHPHANAGRALPDDLASVREVERMLPVIDQLARLFLEHPGP